MPRHNLSPIRRQSIRTAHRKQVHSLAGRRSLFRRMLVATLVAFPITGCATGNPWQRSETKLVSSQPVAGRSEGITAKLKGLIPFRKSINTEDDEAASIAAQSASFKTASIGLPKPKPSSFQVPGATHPVMQAGFDEPAIVAESASLAQTEGLKPTAYRANTPNTVAPFSQNVPASHTVPVVVASSPIETLELSQPATLPVEYNAQPVAPLESRQTIDLSSALGMAGSNSWAVHLARQKTVEAHADVLRAKALWLPNLQAGFGWNKHDGRIQVTEGQVGPASRNSFFYGGGATLGSAPVAGGSGGPLRLSADLALADAYFGSKIANCQLAAQQAGVSVARNAVIRDAGLAYVDLVEAAGQIADARVALEAITQLVELTQSFEEAGATSQADVDRANAERARLEQDVQNTRRILNVRSIRLARILRFDPQQSLFPADQVVVPFELVNQLDVNTLVGAAHSMRPELTQFSRQINAQCLEVKRTQVDPWLPRLTMTTSAGSFGGGTGSSYQNSGGRSDIDLQAVWELDSMGLGVAADRRKARSLVSQRRIQLADLKDQIASEVLQAYESAANYRTQIGVAEEALRLAEISFDRNFQRVRASEGLPIELLQAVQAKAAGLRARTLAVSNYNRAQVELLYAIGRLVP